MDHSSHMMNSGVASHSGHGDMDMGDDSCSMNMIFTWDYKNTCVVFRWWHIRTTLDLVISFVAIAFLCYLYEFLKYYLDKKQASYNAVTTNSTNQSSTLEKRMRFVKSCYYGVQVGFSFLLMLVFMTYNGWLMLAIVFGSIWGNYSWGFLATNTIDNNSLACH